MEGWTFAAVALGAVLGFEYIVFRYFTPERTTAGWFDGASEASDTRGSGVDGSDGGRAAHAEHDADEPLYCEACGTPNADEPTIVFCRTCLGRLR